MYKRIITIQKLSNEDYLKMDEIFPQIQKKDLEDSLGFADKEAGGVYIRENSVKGIEDAALQHEIQEILAETSPHEKDGIRFGWFKKIFGFSSQPAVRALAPIIAGILAAPLGPLASAAAAGGASALAQKTTTGKIDPMGVGLSAAGGGFAGAGMGAGVAAAKGAGSSYLGQVGSGLLGFTPTATVAGTKGLLGSGGNILGIGTKSLAATGPGAVAPNLLGSPSGLIGPATEAQAAKGYASLAQVPASTQLGVGVFPRIEGAFAQPSTPNVPLQPNILSNSQIGSGGIQNVPKPSLSEKVGEFVTNPTNLLGAGSLMASQAPKTPQFEMPSQVADIQAKLMQGEALSPLGQQARSELSKIMASKPSELSPTANDEFYNAALRRTRQSYTTAEEQLDAAYNNAGMYGSGEHLAAKAKLKEELARTESGLAAETEQRRFELARTAQYQATQDALGVDKDVMDDLAGLTGLDVQTAAMLYGAKTADVQAIRENLGTLGVELLLRGQGVQKSGGLALNSGQ